MGWFYAEYYELIVMSKVMSLSALVSGECSRSCLHLFLEFGLSQRLNRDMILSCDN